MTEREWFPVLCANQTTLCGRPFRERNGDNAVHHGRLADSRGYTLCAHVVSFAYDDDELFVARHRETDAFTVFRIVDPKVTGAFCEAVAVVGNATHAPTVGPA